MIFPHDPADAVVVNLTALENVVNQLDDVWCNLTNEADELVVVARMGLARAAVLSLLGRVARAADEVTDAAETIVNAVCSASPPDAPPA